MAVLEGDLRRVLRDPERFPSGTVSFCEFAKGADAGLPDTFIAIRGEANSRGVMVPLELKRGGSVAKALRPSQRRWHRMANEFGVPTYGLTLTNSGSVLLYVILIDGLALNERLVSEVPIAGLNYQWLSHYLTDP